MIGISTFLNSPTFLSRIDDVINQKGEQTLLTGLALSVGLLVKSFFDTSHFLYIGAYALLSTSLFIGTIYHKRTRQIKDLQTNVTNLNQSLTELDKTKTQLGKHVSQLEDEVNSLHLKNKKLDKIRRSFKTENDRYHTENAQLQQTSHQLRQEVTQFNTENQQLSQSNTELRGQITDLRMCTEQIRTDLGAENATFHANNEALTSEVSSLQTFLEQLRNEIVHLRTARQDLTGQLDTSTAELNRTAAQLNTIAGEFRTLITVGPFDSIVVNQEQLATNVSNLRQILAQAFNDQDFISRMRFIDQRAQQLQQIEIQEGLSQATVAQLNHDIERLTPIVNQLEERLTSLRQVDQDLNVTATLLANVSRRPADHNLTGVINGNRNTTSDQQRDPPRAPEFAIA